MRQLKSIYKKEKATSKQNTQHSGQDTIKIELIQLGRATPSDLLAQN